MRYIGSTEFTGTDFEELEREAQEASQFVWVNTGLTRDFYNRYDDAWLVLDDEGTALYREFSSLDAAIEHTFEVLDLVW